MSMTVMFYKIEMSSEESGLLGVLLCIDKYTYVAYNPHVLKQDLRLLDQYFTHWLVSK